MFFLLYKHADDAVFDDFPKISDRFPKISKFVSKARQTFPSIFRRLPKATEKDPKMFRSYTNKFKCSKGQKRCYKT